MPVPAPPWSVRLSNHAQDLDADGHDTYGSAPTGAAGGDLAGTYPNPTVVDDSHAHSSATAPGGIGPILITSSPAGSPLIFADLLQNSEGTDLLYASEA